MPTLYSIVVDVGTGIRTCSVLRATVSREGIVASA